MPICYNAATKEWSIENASEAEEASIHEIGKKVIVEGLSHIYVSDNYKLYLKQLHKDNFYNS